MAVRATFFGHDDPASVGKVQALRKALFVDGLGWQLRVDGDREFDQFDVDGTVHVLLHDDHEACGCFRLVRADRPYLAKMVFPHLAAVFPYPERPDAWEVSRFGVTGGNRNAALGLIAYGLLFRFAQWTRATSLVAMSGLEHERFLRSIGIRTRRYGPPREVGRDRSGQPLRVVAGEITTAAQDTQRVQRLLALLQDVEIVDHASLLGPGRLSA